MKVFPAVDSSSKPVMSVRVMPAASSAATTSESERAIAGAPARSASWDGRCFQKTRR